MRESNAGTEPEDQTVRVISCAADRTVADELSGSLRTMGVRILAEGADAASAIVLISATAVHDAAWREEVARRSGARLVPVAIGDVRPGDVPAVVAELNWIAWDPSNAAAACTTALVALNGDLDRYRLHRALVAEAGAWAAGSCSKHLLIQDRTRAKAAGAHLRQATGDSLARPTEEMRAFVAASLVLTKRARRRQRRRWVWRALAALVAVVVLAALYTDLRTGGAGSRVSVIAAYSSLSGGRPDRVAVLSVDAMVRDDAHNGNVARVTLRQALSERWSEGVIGAMTDARIQYARPVLRGTRILTLNGLGELASSRRDTLDVEWRRPLHAGAFPTALDATDDGRRAAVTAGRRLLVLALGPWRREVVTLPAQAESVALAPADGAIAVGTGDGRVLAVSLRAPHRVRTVARGSAVLALRRTASGHARALVRLDALRLSLVDAIAGRTLATARRRSWQFERGAIGPDGEAVALTLPDRQIAYAPRRLGLRPTGQAVPDVVDVLEVLPGARVAFGGATDGVALLDVSQGLVLGRVCSSLAAVRGLWAADDTDLVACGDQQVIELWRTRDLSPVTPPRDRRMLSDRLRMRQGEVTVAGHADGTATLVTRWRRGAPVSRRIHVAHAAVTASAIVPPVPTAVFGAADGEVTEVDVAYGAGEVSHWTAPDRAAVTDVGWTSDRRRLLVHTAAGNWWSPWSCSDCGSARAMVGHVAARIWGCYVPQLVDITSKQTRELLGIHTCASLPEPSGG